MDMTPNGQRVVVIENVFTSSGWVASGSGWSKLKQVTFTDTPVVDLFETDSGDVLAVDGRQIYVSNLDGGSRRLLLDLATFHLARCGSFVIASALHQGKRHIMRLDPNTAQIKSLAIGNLVHPSCAADGRFVYYVDYDSPQRVMRVAVNGGESTEVFKYPANGNAGPIAVSNDGKLIAVPFEQTSSSPGEYLGIFSSAGTLLRQLPVDLGSVEGRSLEWNQDDTALRYLAMRNGITNIWQQSVSGGPAVPLTNFKPGPIYRFSWSRDHERLFLCRGGLSRTAAIVDHPAY